VDAAAQLAGKPSMMNRNESKVKKGSKSGKVNSMPGMDM